jgi:hypothetical protein
MSNDFPNCGVVDQFHNDLLVEGLTDSDNIPTLPGTWPLIEHKWRLNSLLSQRGVGEKSISRAHVEISTPFDISTRDLRHAGARRKILLLLN